MRAIFNILHWYSTTVPTASFSKLDFQIGFREFPSLLQCALCIVCAVCPSHPPFTQTFLHFILYFSPLCKTVCPSHPSLTQTFPQWPIIQFTLARNREELAFKFSIIVLHQGRGHPIENFANVINESNIFRIQLLHWNIKMFFLFLAKKTRFQFQERFVLLPVDFRNSPGHSEDQDSHWLTFFYLFHPVWHGQFKYDIFCSNLQLKWEPYKNVSFWRRTKTISGIEMSLGPQNWSRQAWNNLK